jgi:ABC-type Fe3+-hydroxamate transport system substrate-binding protein
MKIRRITVALLAAAAFALTACGHSSPPASTSSATTTVAPEPTPTPELTPDDMTDAIVDITWGQTSEADKDDLCAGIALLGTDWAAEQLAIGGGDDSLDWDRAAVLYEAKCNAR